MITQLILRNSLLAVHVLGAVAWVGGMLFAMLVLRPALAVLAPPQRLALHLQVFTRFFRLIWHVAPLMLITGYAMIFGLYGGMGGVNGAVHAMHGLGLIMTVIFLVIWFGPFRAFRAAMVAGDNAAAASSVARIRRLILINLLLGLVTVAIAAFG
jgi:uncharacterized membrane protein